MYPTAKQFRHTTLLIGICLAVLFGLAISYSGLRLPFIELWLVVGVTLLTSARLRVTSIVGVVMVGVSIGILRGAAVHDQLKIYAPLTDSNVSIIGTANEDAVYSKNGQLTFVAVSLHIAETGESLPGQIGVSGFGLNSINQDDEIIFTGKLREGIGSYQGFMSYAQLELVQHHPTPVAQLRRMFGAGMLSALPEPLGSFSMGLLIGQRATLPEAVKDNLQKIGLTHIIAVSGANLTIMLNASRRLLGKRSKRLSFALTFILMFTFVLMTGGSASIVRAAFVSSLSLLAAYYGRSARPMVLIALVAAVTALINPLYLWGDASWYLSFLAFFGVLMVSPRFQSRLPRIFHSNILLAIALESLCAEIMSLPYILFTFGQMSYVGLLANVVVVSVIPFAMLFGFIAGLAGMFCWPLSGWFSWPAKFLLEYMIDISNVIAHWPHIFKENVWLGLPGIIICYSMIVLMVLLLDFKDRSKSGTITDNEPSDPLKILGRMS